MVQYFRENVMQLMIYVDFNSPPPKKKKKTFERTSSTRSAFLYGDYQLELNVEKREIPHRSHQPHTTCFVPIDVAFLALVSRQVCDA